MPNIFDSNGLQTATQAELLANFTAAYKAIYGSDINLASDTPDGQMMNIDIQAILDLEDLLTQINSQFDPDQAVGTILDQRVAINGIQRQAGTFTTTNITLVLTQSVNLYGLDQTVQDVYTVADNAGNQWELLNTHLGAGPGTVVYAFQAAQPGAVLTVPNTITVPVTIVLGVQSINNPTTYTTLGTNEESDAALRVRRQISVSLASQGYLSSLLAALKNISGVTGAFVYENTQATTNSDGVPGHSIWVIIAGTAAAADIANAIYTKRNAGCGMFGAQTFTITQVDGTSFIVSWDNVVQQTLYTAFYAASLNGVTPPNIAAIKTGLQSSFAPGVNQEVNVNQLSTLVQSIDSNTLCLFSGSGTPATAGFSAASGGPYTNTLSPSTKNRQFQVLSSNIIVLPTILSAPNATYTIVSGLVTASAVSVAHGGNTVQFTNLGGFGTITYSVFSGAGSINSSTGLYTSSTAGTDVIHAVDSLGNLAICNVTVT